MEPIVVALAILAFLILVVPAALLPLIRGVDGHLEPELAVVRAGRDGVSRSGVDAASDEERIAA
jgi:hypothetical protein